jgi:hypothetical protein
MEDTVKVSAQWRQEAGGDDIALQRWIGGRE